MLLVGYGADVTRWIFYENFIELMVTIDAGNGCGKSAGARRRAEFEQQPLDETLRQRIVFAVPMGQQSPVRTANGFLHQGLQHSTGERLPTRRMPTANCCSSAWVVLSKS